MHTQSGFTLFELMIAIAIVAILSAVGIPAYQGYIQKAALTDALQSAISYKTAVELCVLENGDLSTCNNGLAGIPASKASRYLSSISVNQGEIKLVGQATLNDLSISLIPQLDAAESGIAWQRRCTSGSNQSLLLQHCESVFRFNEAN